MSIKKLSLRKETLGHLTEVAMNQVQGGAHRHRATQDQYTCNGSVGIACTQLNCDPSLKYTACGSVGIICTAI